jgi:hypothetical protein
MLRSRPSSCNTWSIASATLTFSAGSGWIPLTTRQGFTPAAGRVVERIRLLEQTAAPPLLAWPHRLLLVVQTICSLHLDLAPPAAGESLIVSNPRRSQSMVLRNSRQWLRPRHQMVRAQGRQIVPPARRLRRVLGPLPKKSAPERASPPRLSFSFHASHQPFTKQ